MSKRKSKKITIALLLTALLSLFVSPSITSAANGVTVNVSRIISAESDAGKMQIGDLQIKEDSDYIEAFSPSGDSFIVTLPANLKWDKDKYVNDSCSGTGDIKINFSGDYTLTVKLTGTNNKDTYTIPMYVDFDEVEEGYAYATIESLDSPIPNGDYAIANVLSGGTTLTCVNTFVVGQDSQDNFIIRLTETTAGTFADDKNEKITLTLPKNVNFMNTTDKHVTVIGLGGFEGEVTNIEYDENKIKFDLSELTKVTKSGDKTRGILEIIAWVDVDAKAKIGEVIADIESDDNTVNAESVKIGTVADYGVALGVDDPTTVFAGKVCQELGTITIYENVPETLTINRSIILTLPDGVKFAGKYKQSELDVSKGGIQKSDISISADESELTLKVTKQPTSRLKIEIPMEALNIAPDFMGDIVVNVSGRAGVEGEVVIGTVVAPVEVAIDTIADVKIGYQNQVISNIIITEAETGVLVEDGMVYIDLKKGVTFTDDNIDVNVTAGNLEITNVKTHTDGLSFKIKSESTGNAPAKIIINNLALSVDRTVTEGPIEATVTGTAVVQSYEGYINEKVVKNEYDINDDINEDYMFNEKELGRFVIANCVTPGVQESVKNNKISKFIIGSRLATINNAATILPNGAIPMIRNERALLPVRYVAYACGVTDSNVLWDAEAQKVILKTNDTIIQLTINDYIMKVNDTEVYLDVTPQIYNDYVFLPARAVATALHYNVEWNTIQQMVNINK